MKKMMGLMIYGSLIFGLSAGGAWFLHLRHQEELARERAKLQPDPDEELVPSATDYPSLTDPGLPEKSDEATLARIPVQPERMTPEELVKVGLNLKERDAAVRAREEALERVEARYMLMLRDIEAEQREIEGLMVQAREQRRAAEELLSQADAKEQEAVATLKKVAEERKEIQARLDRMAEQKKKELLEVDTADSATAADESPSASDREKNLKQLSEMLAGMSPEAAARALAGYIENGEMDTAVQLIARMEGRKSAAILEAMGTDEQNRQMVDELLQEFTRMKRSRTASR